LQKYRTRQESWRENDKIEACQPKVVCTRSPQKQEIGGADRTDGVVC
jgi:hypothetical protein